MAWMRGVASQRRFGLHDRRGTANLIDDHARRRAIASMRSGLCVSLSRPLATATSVRGDGRPAFALQRFRSTFGDVDVGTDHVELDCHGSLATHLDGFNHVGLDGTWFSGWPIDDMDACSVEEFAVRPLFTRGVIADIPELRQADWVDPEDPVSGEDIDRALEAAGVDFLPGDALLLYMGRDRYESVHGPFMPFDQPAPALAPGVGRSGAEWILDHGVSVLTWDFQDAHHPDESPIAVHLLIWAAGLVVVDNCDFARVIAARAASGSTGAMIVAPLFIAGATGCDVNPLLVL